MPPSRHSTSMDDADSDCDSDHSTRMSLESFTQSTASSKTSVDVSMRSSSPTPSVYSVTSSLRAQAYIQEYGRDLNNYSDVYRLPADEEELQRLDNQYEMFCKVLGKYPPSLPAVLADDGFEVKGVAYGVCCLTLTCSCAKRSRIMDVAREFPHCSAVAVDLTLKFPRDKCPQIAGENGTMSEEHFYGDFNVVHAQLIAAGIRDYHAMINQISHVLRPGGLIDITEYPFYFTGPDKKPIIKPKGTFEPPWTALWMSYANRAISGRGWLDFWMPASPWLKGDDPHTIFWNDIATTLREDMKAFMKSGRPLLLGHGLPANFVDAMEHNACQELDEAKTPLYALIRNVYARKRH
ncbi:S-adenosyl-L-methionine-dependent methyltransferase [Pisolithus microcarpus]|nr:S-adenosyl-L-methionine-dependent methyltransferase [Pisolithus microcarpus]